MPDKEQWENQLEEYDKVFLLADENGWGVWTDDKMVDRVNHLGLEQEWSDQIVDFLAHAELGDYVKIPNGRIVRISKLVWEGVPNAL